MKYIVTRRATPNSPFDTVGVLTQVCQGVGTQMGLTDIRERIKILDAVEKPGRYIEMEDGLHKKLCSLIEGFTFSLAHRDLLVIVDDVLRAGDAVPPADPGADGPEDAQQTGG